MRSFVNRLRFLAVLGLLALPPVSGNAGQFTPMPGPDNQRDPISDINKTTDPNVEKLHKQQVKALNEQRQKQLVTDTDKLLELATELKTEVGKTDKDTLSVTVIRKTEQIEKLAKSVREKMKAAQ
jgi:hypothetical protein